MALVASLASMTHEILISLAPVSCQMNDASGPSVSRPEMEQGQGHQTRDKP